MNAPNGSHDQPRIQSGGKAFSHHVSEIKLGRTLGQNKEVAKVTAHFCERGVAERDFQATRSYVVRGQ